MLGLFLWIVGKTVDGDFLTSDDVELLCPQCHGMVHATYTNATLARVYPTIEQLRQAPELEAFLRWVRKQPPSRRKRNLPRKRKL